MSIDLDSELLDQQIEQLEPPEYIRRTVSHIQSYEPIFGAFSGPLVDRSLEQAPLEEIQSEYESIMTEMDNHIEHTNTEIQRLETVYKGRNDKITEEKEKLYEEVKKTK